jgi:hypothetical protein
MLDLWTLSYMSVTKNTYFKFKDNRRKVKKLQFSNIHVSLTCIVTKIKKYIYNVSVDNECLFGFELNPWRNKKVKEVIRKIQSKRRR